MAQYQPDPAPITQHGMGPWTKPVSPQPPVTPGTVKAQPPEKHQGSADHPQGRPPK
jgi:hypothetical protein